MMKTVCTRRRPLGEKTLAVSVRHCDGTLEYDAHNLYPLFQAVATVQALQRLRGKRSFILSRCATRTLLSGLHTQLSSQLTTLLLKFGYAGLSVALLS